ncbi:MAG: phosphoenolpyruvate--protein phosphotransferase [Actinomycetota bacterium]
MKRLRGVAASPGARRGPAAVVAAGPVSLPEGPVEDPVSETTALEKAMETVAAGLEARAATQRGELSEILEAQAAMARDPELLAGAQRLIEERALPGGRAVMEAGEGYALALEASDSDYMAARAQDVRDVCRRVAAALAGEASQLALEGPSVVVAKELMPADVADLDLRLVRAFATEGGSRTSHTAIVARSLGVPAVVGVDGLVSSIAKGMPVGVDGDSGTVYLDPDSKTTEMLDRRSAERAARIEELRTLAGDDPAATGDGTRVEIAANVASLPELQAALEAGAEGVGLLRTELSFLERAKPPSEKEQVRLFSNMAELLGDRRLVIRTFDIGADKPVPFLNTEEEENPALGVRGIRLARRHPEILSAQLRAAVQTAEGQARVSVMAPMVSTLEDARWFADQVEAAGGRDTGVEVGVMIEVPSVVFLMPELASILDFVSIGTNDLTQYLHAADRGQGSLAGLQDPFSPALLRAVARICDGAEGKAWVGVCGEAAGDPGWALLAVGLGIRELSMDAGSILEVKAALRRITLEECRVAAEEAACAHGPEEARSIARGLLG